MKWQQYVYVFIFVMLATVVSVRYFEYKVNENYQIFSYGECDPTVNSCFEYDCSLDPDPECDDSPYKKILVRADMAPDCILENDCEEYECLENLGCENIFCSDNATEEGESCVTEQFTESAGISTEPIFVPDTSTSTSETPPEETASSTTHQPVPDDNVTTPPLSDE